MRHKLEKFLRDKGVTNSDTPDLAELTSKAPKVLAAYCSSKRCDYQRNNRHGVFVGSGEIAKRMVVCPYCRETMLVFKHIAKHLADELERSLELKKRK